MVGFRLQWPAVALMHLGLVELGAGLAMRQRVSAPGCSRLAGQELRMPLVEARTGLKRHRPPHEVVDADDLLLVARADGGAAGVAVHAGTPCSHSRSTPARRAQRRRPPAARGGMEERTPARIITIILSILYLLPSSTAALYLLYSSP